VLFSVEENAVILFLHKFSGRRFAPWRDIFWK